jgi:hypothetical protein
MNAGGFKIGDLRWTRRGWHPRRTGVMERWREAIVALLLVPVITIAAHAQTLSVDHSTYPAGGGASSNGVYTVTDTLGEPVAGPASGSRFAVDSGFWGRALPPLPAGPVLTLATATLSVLEDKAPRVFTNFVSEIQPGADANTVTLSVANDNHALFLMQPGVSRPAGDNSVGHLTFVTVANASGSATITITLRNNRAAARGGPVTATFTFTLTIVPVNDPPLLAALPNLVLNEDAGLQTLPLTLAMGPGEASQRIISLTASSSNPGLFAGLDPDFGYSGAGVLTASLRLTPAADASGVAVVTVVAQDDGGVDNGGRDSVTNRFTVTVTALNDAPVFSLAAPTVTVLEDSGSYTDAAFALGVSAGADNEAGQTLTFAVGSDNPALFSVAPRLTRTGNTGALTFTPAPNAFGQATVTVQLLDNGPAGAGQFNASAVQSFVIEVLPVNDPPAFNVTNVTVYENSGSHQVVLTGINAGPANEGQSVTSLEVFSSLPSLVAPKVKYTPGSSTVGVDFDLAPDAKGTATITVVAQDSGGGNKSATNSFLVTVVPVNSAPRHAPLAVTEIVVAEDAPQQTIENFLTGLSPGAADEAGQILSFPVTFDTAKLFFTTPTLTRSLADPTTARLTFRPAPKASGQGTLTFYVRDNGGTLNGGVDTSATSAVTITVAPFNDPPTLGAIPSATLPEDTVAHVALSGIAPAILNETNQLLAIVATSSNPALLPDPEVLYTNGNPTALLVLRPNPDANGIANVTVTVTDDGQSGAPPVADPKSVTRTFKVTVTAVNDPPGFLKGADVVVEENAPLTTLPNWASQVTAGPANEGGQTLAFQVSNDQPALFQAPPALTAAGTLTFRPATNASGIAVVSVWLQDSAGAASAVQTFHLRVLPDLYVADRSVLDAGAGRVLRIPALGGGPDVVTNGLLNAYGLALVTQHDLVVAAFGTYPARGGAILRLNGAGLALVSTNQDFVSPFDVALAPGGDLLVVDAEAYGGLGAVLRVHPGTGVQTLVASNFVNLAGLAVAADGGIFVTDGGDGGANLPCILRISASTGVKTVVASGADAGNLLVTPAGLAIEPGTGDLIVADPGAPGLLRVTPAGIQSVISTGGWFQMPAHVAVEPTGDFVVTDPGLTPRIIRVTAGGVQTILVSGGLLVSPQGVVSRP